MKKTFFFLIISLFSLSALANETKILLHLNDIAKLPHLEGNIVNIRKGMGKEVDIKVIINGRAAKSMLKGNKLIEEKIQSIIANDVSIGLCNSAIKMHKININHLIKGITVLPENGTIRMISLQQEGYIYIKM